MLVKRMVKLPRTRLSEPMEHRRAQRLRRKTRRSGRSGQGDACEERAQGNGEPTVRVMRRQARMRRGGGIPPTKHRDANGGCSAREESSFSPKRVTSMRRLAPVPEGAMRGLLRRRQRGGTCENEASRAGLRPDGVYIYAERPQGRANRPFLAGEHRCDEASRTMSGKPAQDTRQRLNSAKH